MVLLKGYYGKGNFGDDVLCRVTCELLRGRWGNAELFLDAPPSYLAQIAGAISARPAGRGRHYDLIVHGGGGTFFDFQPGPWWNRWLNRAVLFSGGRPYAALDRLLRKLIRRPRDRAQARLGWGMGIGTFTPTSSTLRHLLPALLDFSGLMVRDAESIENLHALGVTVPVHVGSDAAFLHHLWWCPELAPPHVPGSRKLGVVLRDWPSTADARVSQGLIDAVLPLSGEYDITWFAFDRSSDADTVARLKGARMVVWDPEVSSLCDFAAALSSMDMLVTARAHGAICGAIVGLPSLIVQIEPKLRVVHEMLPQSTRLVGADAATTDLRSALCDLASVSRELIASEVEQNRCKSQAGIESLLEVAEAVLSRRNGVRHRHTTYEPT